MKKSRYFTSLESLRGIASVFVVLYHLPIEHVVNKTFVGNAWVFVDFFFVLSGFVISLNYSENLKSFQDLVIFQKGRFKRLFPLHLFTLLLFVAFEFLKLFITNFTSEHINFSAFSEPNGLQALIYNVFLLQNFLMETTSFNYPSWSISAEFYIYLLFAIVTGFLQTKVQYFLYVVVVSACFYYFLSSDLTDFNIDGPLRCAFSFIIGVGVYKLYLTTRKYKKNIFSGSLTLCFFIFLTMALLSGSSITVYQHFVIYPYLFAVVIFITITTSNDASVIRVLNAPLLRQIGKISYSIYMVHAFIWMVLSIGLHRTFPFLFASTSEPSQKLIFVNPLHGDMFVVGGVICIIITSLATHKYIEQRFRY